MSTCRNVCVMWILVTTQMQKASFVGVGVRLALTSGHHSRHKYFSIFRIPQEKYLRLSTLAFDRRENQSKIETKMSTTKITQAYLLVLREMNTYRSVLLSECHVRVSWITQGWPCIDPSPTICFSWATPATQLSCLHWPIPHARNKTDAPDTPTRALTPSTPPPDSTSALLPVVQARRLTSLHLPSLPVPR